MIGLNYDPTTWFGQVTGPVKSASDTFKVIQERVIATNQELSLKVLDIAQKNTTFAFDALRSLATASDLSQVLNVQQNFVREQASNGLAQIREVGDIVAKAGRETIAPVTDAFARVGKAA